MLNHLHMSPDDFRRSMPPSARRRVHVDIPPQNRAHALERLNELLQPEMPGRFYFARDKEHAWIIPSEDDTRCTVLAEAADMETAGEICNFYERLLRRAADTDAQ